MAIERRKFTDNGNLLVHRDGEWVRFTDHQAALSAVTAENDRLREALKPFAEAGQLVDEHRPDAPDAVPFHVMVDEEDNGIITLTWGQLRAAVSALTSEDRT